VPKFSSTIKTESILRDNLFDLLLPLPPDSIYRDLNLDPSATSEEVGWAVKILNDERRAEKSRLDEAIRKTAAQVPELPAALDGERKTSSSGAADERSSEPPPEMVNRALNIDPGFQENRRKSKELGEKIDALNGMDLGKQSGLSRYDEAHPPFALLKLAPSARDQFLEQPRSELWILRREISRFLKQNGENVVHSSDLEREDFTADFCPNPLLDGGK
jgi:hypothetical protein